MKNQLVAALAVLVLFAAPSGAQTFAGQEGSVTLTAYATEAAAGAHSMYAVQANRAALIPLITALSYDPSIGIGDRVSYVVINQPVAWETATVSGMPTSALPVTSISSGNCAAPPYVCSGSFLTSYTVSEFTTHAAAKAYRDGLPALARPHTFGPLATPRQTFIVVAPSVQSYSS